MSSSRARFVIWAAGGIAIVMLTAHGIDAHKGITSRYTYNDDVYPILRDKCGQCHIDGGPTPMSLLAYNENGGAVAWAESIREMLVSEAMPPWYADPMGPAVKNPHSLSPRQLDIVITWATGGTPQGDQHKKPAPAVAHAQWTLGKPDVTLAMEKPETLPVGVMSGTADATIPTNFTEAKWVRAADLMPGNVSMVRQATISVEGGPVLAVWQPGDDPATAPSGTAFKIPAGAKLHLHLRYKKGWQEEQNAASDTSTVGLYLTDEPLSGKAIESFVVEPPAGDAPPSFGAAITTAGRILAIRTSVDQAYASVDITAVSPTGRKVPLLKLRGIRPEWPRRYWLADPVELPKGTRIEVTTAPGDPDTGPLGAATKSPLQFSFDLVAQ